jgi:hypothetical protein
MAATPGSGWAMALSRRAAGWPEALDEPPHVGQGDPDLVAQRLELAAAGLGVHVEHRGRRLGAHPHGREGRPQAVVEIAAEPPSLLLSSEHQALSRSGEVVAQPLGVDRGARLAREVGQQGELGGTEPSLARPHAEEQAPDRLGPVGEGHRLERGGRRALFGNHCTAATLVDDLETDVGQPERLGDRFRDCGERALRIDGPFEPRPQDAHRAPWLVARAVHRPVDGALQDVP